MSIEVVYYAFQLKIHAKTTNLKTNHTQWNTLSPLHPKRINEGNSGFLSLPVAPSLYILGLSHMLINEFKCIRLSLYVKMKIKQNLTNVISTKIIVQFFFWWDVTGSVHLTKSYFYLINLERWQNIQTPLYGHQFNTNTSFWLRTVCFVPDYSLNIFYKFNPPTNTLFMNFWFWLIRLLLWKKDGIYCYHANLAAIVLGYTLCSAVSLLTLTAISVDRLVTLFLQLRYRHVVSLSGNTSTHHSTGDRERKLIDISSLFNIYTGSPSSKYEHRRASALLRTETIGFFSHTNPYILNVT